MPERQRIDYIESMASRLDFLKNTLHGLGVDIPSMFAAVGADYQQVVDTVLERRSGILDSLALPIAA